MVGRLAVELLADHTQDGDRCSGCGERWPCPTRAAAPGHYAPGLIVLDLAAAVDVLARHTERDGHCTACGEEWACAPWRQASKLYDRLAPRGVTP